MGTVVNVQRGDTLKCSGTGDFSSAESMLVRDDALARSKLLEEELVKYDVPLSSLYVWDAPDTDLPTTPAGDDLGYIERTWGTDAEKVQTDDLASDGAQNRYACGEWVVPPEYVANGNIKLRFRAAMVTTIADTTCTIDLVVYKLDGDGGIGSDLCTTAAQDINTLTDTDYDFVITPTGIVPGDKIEFRVHIACNDAATGTVVMAQISKITPMIDIKG